MDFSIVTDTAGASVSELASALRDLLVDNINKKYEKYNISIGIAIRCLPDSYRRRSFVRYTKSDNWKSHTNLTHPGKYFRPSKVKIMRPTSPK